MLVYTILDLKNSSITFQDDNSRMSVYFVLIILIVFLALYNGVNLRSNLSYSTQVKTITILFVLMLISNLVSFDLSWNSIIHLGLSFWWIMTLIFGQNIEKKDTNNLIQKFSLLIFIIYIFYTINTITRAREIYDEYKVLNISYRILVMIPLLSLNENLKLKNIIYLITFILLMFSLKRGAFLIYVLMLVFSFIIDNYSRKKGVKGLTNLILSVFLIIVLFYIFNSLTNNVFFERFRFSDLIEGSGRNILYKETINKIKTGNLKQIVFGSGSNLTTVAHNDFLEMFHTFGIFAFMVYMFFVISIILRFYYLVVNKSKYASSYSMVVVYIVYTSLISQFYLTHGTWYIMLFLGVIESKIQQETKELKNLKFIDDFEEN